MDAVKFAREYGRMCTTPDRSCGDCPMGSKCDGECTIYMAKYPESAVRIVQKWSKEHPRTTYLLALLEKFPNASFAGRDFTPPFCPHELFGGTRWEKCVDLNCFDCWNREYKEGKKENEV